MSIYEKIDPFVLKRFEFEIYFSYTCVYFVVSDKDVLIFLHEYITEKLKISTNSSFICYLLDISSHYHNVDTLNKLSYPCVIFLDAANGKSDAYSYSYASSKFSGNFFPVPNYLISAIRQNMES